MASTVAGGYRITADLLAVLEARAQEKGWTVSRYAGWVLSHHLNHYLPRCCKPMNQHSQYQCYARGVVKRGGAVYCRKHAPSSESGQEAQRDG